MNRKKGYITTDNSWGASFTVNYTTRPDGRKYTKLFNTRIEARHFLDGKPNPTAYEMIQYHMREMEKRVLRNVRTANKLGRGYRTPEMCGHKWYNALYRLEKKGMIRFRHLKSYDKRGYYIVTKGR